MKEVQLWSGAHLGTVHLVAANEIQYDAFGHQSHGQAERVMAVSAARQQCGFNLG